MEAVTDATAITALILFAVAATSLVVRGQSRLLLWCAWPFAIETIMQQRHLFAWLAGATGAGGLLSVIQETLCVIAIGAMIIFAAEGRPSSQPSPEFRARVVTVVALSVAAQAALWIWRRWSPRDAFLLEFLHQPSAVAYTSIQWILMFAVAGLAIQSTLKNARLRLGLSLAVGLAVVSVGAGVALVAAFLHFATIYEAWLGSRVDLLVQSNIIAINVSATLIATGMSIPFLGSVVQAAWDRTLVALLHLIWHSSGARHGPLVLTPGTPLLGDLLAPDARLVMFRRWIELQDYYLSNSRQAGAMHGLVVRTVEKRLNADG